MSSLLTTMANVTGNEVTELLENLITLTNFNTNKLLGRIIADVLHIVKVVGGSMHMLVQSWIKKGRKEKRNRIYSLRICGDKWNSFR